MEQLFWFSRVSSDCVHEVHCLDQRRLKFWLIFSEKGPRSRLRLDPCGILGDWIGLEPSVDGSGRFEMGTGSRGTLQGVGDECGTGTG